MGASKIEWTDATWNPVTGCSKVNSGCKNCYAERLWPRTEGARIKHEGGSARPFTDVRIHPERLDAPLRWRKPMRIFVNSMSDLFHEDVPDEFIDRVFAVMASSSKHTYQILTKRPKRMCAYFSRVSAGAVDAAARYERDMRAHFQRYKMDFKEGHSIPEPPTGELRFIYDSAARQEDRPTSPDGTTLGDGFSGGEYHWRSWPLSNVWLCVSVEDQPTADERITLLLQTPAAVRGVSYEPALGPVNFTRVPWASAWDGGWQNPLTGYFYAPGTDGDCGRGHRIDQIIAGGESGPGARPAHPDWFRAVRDQCVEAGVAFFFKQWGEWINSDTDVRESWTCADRFVRVDGTTHSYADDEPYCASDALMHRIGKRAAGRLLDGRKWSEFPT